MSFRIIYQAWQYPRSFQWRNFYTVYCHLNRMEELDRLIRWAKRKKRTNPLRLYQNRLADTSRVLFRYRLHSPGLVSWAQFLQQISKVFRSSPRYFPKGAASVYRDGRG